MEELSVFRGPVVNFGFVKLVHFADDNVMFMTTQRLYPAIDNNVKNITKLI